MKNISIASYSFHGLLEEGKMDVFGYLESCKYRYHLDTADIWNGMLASLDEEYLRKVKEALDEKEMTLVNLCVDLAQLWDDDSEKREQYYKNALANLRAAEILGAKTVRIDMGIRQYDMTEEQFEHIVKRYQEYIKIADSAGFKVGPENHYGASRVPDHIVRVSEAVDHPAYGVLLHFGSWEADRENGDRRLAKWAMHCHLSASTVVERLETSLRTLMDIGYTGYWGVEHHSGKNEYGEVEWQLAEVRRVMKAWKSGLEANSFRQSHNPLL